MARLRNVQAREILDSRGTPTVQATVELDDGSRGTASVPSGASRGKFEAWELRDEDPKRYLGRGVLKAVGHVRETIAKKVIGLESAEPKRQAELDQILIGLDGTPNKSKLGANAILAVSIAFAKASALSGGKPLYRWFAEMAGREGRLLPVPLMNVLNGGRHADNRLDIQEFMLVPVGAGFCESLRMGAEVFHHLKKVLSGKKHSTTVGDEGGFAPDLASPREALAALVEAIGQAGYQAGRDIFIALDAAATEFCREGRYSLRTGEGTLTTGSQLTDYYESLLKDFPIVSLEDGLAEEDWDGWVSLTQRLGKKIQLVGDDLFVTNPKRLRQGIERHAANAILVKPNQIGTLTETLEAIRVAKEAGFRTVLSHRSGETEDSALADLAVGTDSGQIKTGGLSRSERLAKYNRLLVIEEELGRNALWNHLFPIHG